MALFYRAVFITLFIFSHCFAKVMPEKQLTVRVLLSKSTNASLTEWKFVSEKGFLISQIGGGKPKTVRCKNNVTFVVKRGYLFCNGKKINRDIKIEPLCGYAECNGVVYDGYFSLMADKPSFLCINHVDLEDYIAAVLRTESWPGWPLEVNKAFAIMCRSYVTSKIFEVKGKKRLFHIKNTNAHQTYKGKHNVAVLKKAVEQTKGIVLGFNQKPILAMFDSCCGGVIPAHIDEFDFNKAPYLARTYACSYCKHCSLYTWEIAYEIPNFEKMMRQHHKDIHLIHDVRVVKKDKAGLVQHVQLKSRRGCELVSGKQMYSLLNEVKSFHFEMHKKAGKIVVSGRGFGHHLGLCQWGARQMVREGCDYKQILRYYYPETYFMKLL